jgi:hypothetical protein
MGNHRGDFEVEMPSVLVPRHHVPSSTQAQVKSDEVGINNYPQIQQF